MVDRVLPNDVPYRQWVVTVPWDLSRRLAYDALLCGAVIRQVVDALFAWLRGRAERREPARSHPGCVVEVQRAADATTLFVHVHGTAQGGAPDGVFVQQPEGQRALFVRCQPPGDDDVAAIVADMFHRVRRLLLRRGLLDPCADG